jgi:hypothetical protein
VILAFHIPTNLEFAGEPFVHFPVRVGVLATMRQKIPAIGGPADGRARGKRFLVLELHLFFLDTWGTGCQTQADFWPLNELQVLRTAEFQAAAIGAIADTQ